MRSPAPHSIYPALNKLNSQFAYLTISLFIYLGMWG